MKGTSERTVRKAHRLRKSFRTQGCKSQVENIVM